MTVPELAKWPMYTDFSRLLTNNTGPVSFVVRNRAPLALRPTEGRVFRQKHRGRVGSTKWRHLHVRLFHAVSLRCPISREYPK